MFGIDDAIGAALNLGGKIIDRVIPDPAAAAAAKLELIKMQQTGELAKLTAETELSKGQIEVNKVEAANANVFVSGWRPAVGWVCAAALASDFIVRPFAMFIAQSMGHVLEYPQLDVSTLLTLLLGMLGLGAMRTTEKLQGVHSK